jgi:hypothetical protein
VTLTAPASATVGTPVTLVATVSSQYLRPTGTVTFYDGATPLGGPITLVDGTTPITSTASFSWMATPAGPHALTAVYSGDANVLSATSPTHPMSVTESATISIADTSVVEGNTGTTAMTFTVSLSGPLTVPITLFASSTPGTATTPSDFAPLSAVSIPFAPGETAKTVTVNVTGDTTVEPNETLQLTISGTLPTGVTIARATATGTITNDDVVPAAPKLKISQVCTGTNNATYTKFTWAVRNTGTGSVTFIWRVKGATPAQTGTLTLAAGSTSPTFTTNKWKEDTILQVIVNGKVIDEFEAGKNRSSCIDKMRDHDDDSNA